MYVPLCILSKTPPRVSPRFFFQIFFQKFVLKCLYEFLQELFEIFLERFFFMKIDRGPFASQDFTYRFLHTKNIQKLCKECPPRIPLKISQ